MARYTYGGGNQVTAAQNQLSRNLFAMLSAMGDKPLQKARLGLDLSKTGYDIARQRELDELQRPAMKAQAMTATGQIEQAESPIHVSSFMTDMNSLGHMLHQDPKGEEPLLIYKVANYFNADIDNKEGSPTRGQFIGRKTGKPVTYLNARKAAPELNALILANTGTENRIQTEINRLKRRYKQGSIDRATYQAGMKKLDDFRNDPSAQLRVLERQKEVLGQFTDTTNPILQSELTKGIGRVDKNIQERKGVIAKLAEETRKYEHELEKERIKKQPDMGELRTIEKEIKGVTYDVQQAWNGEKWEEIGKGKKFSPSASTPSGAAPSTIEKEAKYWASMDPKITELEAFEILRTDRTLAERLRLAAAEIELIDPMGFMEEEEKAEAVEKILKKHELDKAREYRGLPKDPNDPFSIR